MQNLPRYYVIEKTVGETPLQALERMRGEHAIPTHVSLTYAGRLDPMASGTLLILIGDECKKKDTYLGLDKEYVVEVLLGISSDTGDVLGRIHFSGQNDTSPHSLPNDSVPHSATPSAVSEAECRAALATLRGTITLPYPHFSSKTVRGKPLHQWTLEKRLDEIEVPRKHSRIHRLTFDGLRTVPREEVVHTVRTKIETIPEVTDPKKALGADFRRDAVRADWQAFAASGAAEYQILTFTCVCSSGTYMRSLAEYIGKELGTTALAYSIHRTKIGRFRGLFGSFGIWTKRF